MIKKFNEFLGESLSGARQRYVKTGLVSQEEFQQLLATDKTPTNKFIEAITRFYLESGKDLDFIKSNLETYKSLLNKKIPGFNSDINSFDNFSEWCEYMQKFAEYRSKTEVIKGIKSDKKIILDNERWFIVQPLSWEQSKFYGAGTKWCTSSRDSSGPWESYHEHMGYNIYYVTDKSKDIVDDPDYKVAILATGEESSPFHFFDALNNGITDTSTIMSWMKSNGLNPSLFKPKRSPIFQDDY